MTGLAAVHPRQPGGARLDEAAVLALERELAHVPDVALLVLGVVVEGPLDRRAVLGHGVAHDRGLDAEYPLGPVGDDLVVGLRRRSLDTPVVEPRARDEGQVAIVGPGDEVGRIDVRVVAPVNRG
jgi:hypothetical protein